MSTSDQAAEPYYVVLIGLDAARVIARFFESPPHLSINSDPVVWTIGADAAAAIVAATR